ncbi:MAG: QueT transporter family protein [Clostridia bacterium]|nr:QueT transporter family protein [Clostridia bacterium]
MSNNKPNKKVYGLVQGALIAALYAAATYLSATFSLAYGPVQFRLSEALTILSVFTPYAIPGLTVGCVIANLGSPYGIIDIVLGSFATLIAAIATRAVRNVKVKNLPVLAPLMPVIANAVIVGFEIALFAADNTMSLKNFTLPAFLTAGAQVGLGELVVCYVLGLALYSLIVKAGIDKKYLGE